jgi:hypothetical protein
MNRIPLVIVVSKGIDAPLSFGQKIILGLGLCFVLLILFLVNRD